MNSIKTHKDYIHFLIKEGALKKAINEFREGTKGLENNEVDEYSRKRKNLELKSIQDKVTLIESRYNTNEIDRFDPDDRAYQSRKFKINNTLLSCLKEYNPTPTFKTQGFEDFLNSSIPIPIKQSMPFIALFFANSKKNPLENVEREQNEIEAALTPLKKAKKLDFISNRQTTVQIIFDALRKNNINWFHYAGHASSTSIKLEDQAAFMDGIIDRLISENKANNVVLVFLNGCSTYDNVRRLLNGGINIVISTSAKVNDGLASDFAIEFYKHIADGRTIKTAYYNAVSYVKSRTDQLDISNRATRWSSELGSENDATSNALPWGLYTNDIDSLDQLSIYNLLSAKTTPTQPQPSMPQLPSKDNLFDLIDENDFNQVFEILKVNKTIFKGYQDLRDVFIYDKPSGLALKHFRERLKIFINSKY